MSDMSSMNRENKKRQLRQRMVSSGAPMKPDTKASYDNHKGSEKQNRSPKKKGLRRKGKALIIVLSLLITAGFGGYQYYKYYQYTGYVTMWETPMNEGSLVGYVNFGSNVLKYTKDGASYIDSQGKVVWVESYEMKSPIVSVNGDYVAIADMQGNSIYICNKNGRQGIATTLLPIVRVTVSQIGVAAAVLEDTRSSSIQLYKKDGSLFDGEVKSVLSGDGYPIDISLSPDATQLITSFVHLEDGLLKNRVVFYSFSEIGRNMNNLVGGFDEPFQNSLVPRVVYLSDIYSCAFSDNSIAFFSSKNLASPQMIKQEMIEETIESIFYSDKYVGVIVKAASGENPNRMDIYKIDGEKVFSKEFNFPYSRVDIDGEHIFLYNEDSSRVYNMSGVEKLAVDFDTPVNKITEGRFPNTLIMTGPQVMKEVKLQ